MSMLIEGVDMPKGTNMMLLISPDGDVWEMGDLLGNDKLIDGAKAVPAAEGGVSMGFYIKGKDLPKEEEHYLLQINSDGTVYDAVGRRIAAQAVPVPPHGRLFDADAVSLEGGPYEYDEWCKWALEQYQDAPTIIPADDPKLSATIKCGDAVTCAVASEEVYRGKLAWEFTSRAWRCPKSKS